MRTASLLLVAWACSLPAQKRPLIGIAGFQHESNSFHSVPTRLADFDRRQIPPGMDPIDAWADNNDEIAGYIEEGRKRGFDFHAGVSRSAMPAGPVTRDAYEAITRQLVDSLKAAPRKLDGILLALHGAMVSDDFPHADAETVRRIRVAFGNDMPIVVTHDFHANISPDIVRLSTVLITYKEVPHIDQKERGRKAAEVMSRIVQGGAKPVQVLVKPNMLYNIRFQHTFSEPLKPIVDESKRLERDPAVLAASVSAGYQYADVPAMGASVVVAVDGDRVRAESEARRLSGMLWATRDRLKLDLPTSATAVRMAMESTVWPVTLVEMGDNIGGGSAGDATFLLAELVKQKARGWVVEIADPAAVKLAVKLGVGAAFDGLVGGKTDKAHGEPVRVRGRVKVIHDGVFMDTAIRHGGQKYYDQGLSAVIEMEGSTRDLSSYVLLTTKRMVPFSLHQLYSVGIMPERQKILVAKAAVAFRAAYEPLNGRIIEVDTPGATAVNPARFTFKRVPTDLFGLK
jgi:microcystin degradation protein MlrC